MKKAQHNLFKHSFKAPPHYEVVNARMYYGLHATGRVLLRNGHPEFHGSREEMKLFLKRFHPKGL